MLGDELVGAGDDLVEGRRQVAVFLDVAQELLGEQLLARREVEHLQLFAQMVDQILGLDRRRLDVVGHAAQVGAPGQLLRPIVEQDVLPVRLVLVRLLLLRLLVCRGGRVLFFLGLDQLEERVGQELLLQVLLQVEQRHVEQVHRLIKPRIDPQLLAHRLVLLHAAALHAASDMRARSRAVSVGPRYTSATRSLNTSSRTVPDTCTLPSNMM